MCIVGKLVDTGDLAVLELDVQRRIAEELIERDA
jgi:hypothetical protein